MAEPEKQLEDTRLAPRVSRKQLVRTVVATVALAVLAVAVWRQWGEVGPVLSQLHWRTVVLATLAAFAATFLNALSWRAVMHGVGLHVPFTGAIRIFWLSQIGKYLPGSLWPVVAQMEFARDHGVTRGKAAAGSLVAIAVGVLTSGIIAVVGLVFFLPQGGSGYLWLLFVTPLAAALFYPPVLRWGIGVSLRLFRRDLDLRELRTKEMMVSVIWSALMWLCLGLHAQILLADLSTPTSFAVAVTAFAGAWLIGFVVIFAPAGLGAREGALVWFLSGVASAPIALAFALVSRFVTTLADVLGLLVGLALRSAPQPPAPAHTDVP